MSVLTPDIPDGVALEGLLQQASEEAAWRPAFYRKLLESPVLVILPDEARARRVARPDRIHFVQWKRIDGTDAIPFFSSARTFFEAAPQGARCLVLDTRQLLELTRGAILHLNPYSEFNVELTPSDAEALLSNGTLVVPESFRLQAEREMSFRRVIDPPVTMLHALTLLYSQLPQVLCAYLASVKGMYEGRESLLLGLDIDGDPEPVVRDSSLVIRDTYQGPYDLDIVHIKPGKQGLLNSGFNPTFRFFDRRMADVLAAPSAPRTAQ
ncbi:enhanced serine sensitivity protein SseB C-terminal domain-containing protein [Tahibacter soli]|uniref:Enhanced serine sensitivity protein SseB C-terminal domain-containing protein n=1 Tax=Tahibacter soli TaxID=2983605 RepID=A0A9X3YKA6_9GAMM|nr:enhanced serine sensitivity protein SseB C-terminal domain-containing protein [Tahibacter soli]MDC8012800.1 enhanced serine sensitivity protein SseB C-terminal domain-containing protein [Tahibacter soli]